MVETGAKGLGLDVASTAQAFDTRYHQLTGFHLDELPPIPYAKDVKVPTLVAQVHHDSMTRPEDVQEIYDNFGSKDKELRCNAN